MAEPFKVEITAGEATQILLDNNMPTRFQTMAVSLKFG